MAARHNMSKHEMAARLEAYDEAMAAKHHVMHHPRESLRDPRYNCLFISIVMAVTIIICFLILISAVQAFVAARNATSWEDMVK